jgi:dipeptidase E
MKLLLTSAGIKNPTIKNALEGLLGKPTAESTALVIPTAAYPNAWGIDGAVRFISGQGDSSTPMVSVGWKTVGILELTALPSIDSEIWKERLRKTDALLVNGGDAVYLSHWFKESGVADFLKELPELVYVGFSAGSMAFTPRIGDEFVGWLPTGGDDSTLGIVDFSIFPHVDHPELTENTMSAAIDWAAKLGNPSYAIDDETAIQVVNGEVIIHSEGHWRKFD